MKACSSSEPNLQRKAAPLDDFASTTRQGRCYASNSSRSSVGDCTSRDEQSTAPPWVRGSRYRAHASCRTNWARLDSAVEHSTALLQPKDAPCAPPNDEGYDSTDGQIGVSRSGPGNQKASADDASICNYIIRGKDDARLHVSASLAMTRYEPKASDVGREGNGGDNYHEGGLWSAPPEKPTNHLAESADCKRQL